MNGQVWVTLAHLQSHMLGKLHPYPSYVSFLSMNLKCCWVHVVLGWMKHLWLTDVPICLEHNSVADVLVKFGLAGMQPTTVGSVSQDILIGQVRSWILLLCFSRVCILACVGLRMISLTDVFCGLFQDCYQWWIAEVYYLLVLWGCVITVLDLWCL
jgi:hypothetical protein